MGDRHANFLISSEVLIVREERREEWAGAFVFGDRQNRRVGVYR